MDLPTSRRIILALLPGLLIATIACGDKEDASVDPTQVPSSGGLTLTIGDISDEPAKKIERFQPLADFLAAGLSESGFSRGQVMIASSITEMIQFMSSGQVDIYMDSLYPAVTVAEAAGGEVEMIRAKDGRYSYSGLIIVLDSSEIRDIRDLVGRVIAAEEEYSTTGFAIQTSQLLDAGLQTERVEAPDHSVDGGKVGIWFSRDEENALFALTGGTVDAAFFSDQDFDDLPSETADNLRVISTSAELPRQLVIMSSRLSEGERSRVARLLVDLSDTEEGRELLQHIKGDGFVILSDSQREMVRDLGADLPRLQNIAASR